MPTPIEAAVAPVKLDAQKHAEERARGLVEDVRKQLEAAGWDVNAVAPYPNSLKMGRNEYLSAKGRYTMFRNLTKSRPDQPLYVDGERNKSDLVDMDAARVEKFVAEVRDAAAAQYDAFVAKLLNKVGEHSAATLEGNHVWGRSILTVTTPHGVENWKTQMIFNISCLGKVFNQFPTRKVK